MWFGGKFRIIDFPLSNAVNSGLYRVRVLTQYRPHSLMQHIGIGDPWDLDRRSPNGIQVWQPYRGRRDQDWYRGTADALFQNLPFIAEDGSEETLVLSGDHIYKQDYNDLLRFHREHGADLTVAVMHVPADEVHRFGIMTVDAEDRIVEFQEKPRRSASTLASMGIYVFNTEFLMQRLIEDGEDATSGHDFGKDIIPRMVEHDRVFAYPFDGYWVDVGTIQAYWEANLDLAGTIPSLNLYDNEWVIHTRSQERPPAKMGPHCSVRNSLFSAGNIVDGTVSNSVLGSGVRIEKGAVVRDSVILHDTVIRAGAVVDRCVLDKFVQVGPDAQVGVGDVTGAPANRIEPKNLTTGVSIVGEFAEIPKGAVVGRNCRIEGSVTGANFDGLEVESGGSVCRRKERGERKEASRKRRVRAV
jgi:glucose-1-phosphate adenylyltransferase